MEREVIVVGAGPAGSMAAMTLAQRGRDVLLIDRKLFPRDKPCGDAIPAGAIALLYDMGMREKIEQAGFYRVDKLLISASRGGVMEANFKKGRNGTSSYVVPRLQFDALLQAHAVDSGAAFCQGQVKGPLLEDGRVVGVSLRRNGKTEEIRAKMVVGADGVTSSITRALRPKAKQHQDLHRAVALRAYIEDIQELPHQVEFYLYKGILPGYAWIFPIGEGQANIGLGMRLDRFRRQDKSLEELLQVFMEMPAIRKRLRNGGKLRDVATWQLNFGSQRHMQHAFDGALLAGDAAGFINPLTGGGIDNALISGNVAGDVIDQALKRGDFSRQALTSYEERCHERMWPSMRRAYLFQRTMGWFPLIVDILVKQASSNSKFAQAFLEKL